MLQAKYRIDEKPQKTESPVRNCSLISIAELIKCPDIHYLSNDTPIVSFG